MRAICVQGGRGVKKGRITAFILYQWPHRENYFLSKENKEKLRSAPARSSELVPHLEVPSGYCYTDLTPKLKKRGE